ncbi:hypothetical protein SMICM304S_04548 [Streptomyces microflavus]
MPLMFGAVKDTPLPPWATPVPRTTQWTKSPSSRARLSGLISTAATPSLRAVPSAPCWNGRTSPCGLSIPAARIPPKPAGDITRFTPPTSACSHSPSRMDRIARCRATNEDEHVVSHCSLGPLRSSRYEIRLGTIAGDGRLIRSMAAGRYSLCVVATNTPVGRFRSSAGR